MVKDFLPERIESAFLLRTKTALENSERGVFYAHLMLFIFCLLFSGLPDWLGRLLGDVDFSILWVIFDAAFGVFFYALFVWAIKTQTRGKTAEEIKKATVVLVLFIFDFFVSYWAGRVLLIINVALGLLL